MVMDVLDLMGLPYIFDRSHAGLSEYADNPRLRFDFVVFHGDRELAIEFDGEHHYRPVQFGGRPPEVAEAALERQQTNDATKVAYCADSDTPLLRIHHKDLLRVPRLVGDFVRTNLDWKPPAVPENTPHIATAKLRHG